MEQVVFDITLIIRSPDDLLSFHSNLRRAAHELALNYAHCALDNMLEAVGSGLWQALALDDTFELVIGRPG